MRGQVHSLSQQNDVSCNIRCRDGFTCMSRIAEEFFILVWERGKISSIAAEEGSITSSQMRNT